MTALSAAISWYICQTCHGDGAVVSCDGAENCPDCCGLGERLGMLGKGGEMVWEKT